MIDRNKDKMKVLNHGIQSQLNKLLLLINLLIKWAEVRIYKKFSK